MFMSFVLSFVREDRPVADKLPEIEAQGKL